MNKLDEMRIAVDEANTTLRAADQVAGDLARMLRGRLNKVPYYILADLKRELRKFNMHTGEWRD